MEAGIDEGAGFDQSVGVVEWDAHGHPWRRYGARTIDIGLLSLPVLYLAGLFAGFFLSDETAAVVVENPRWLEYLVWSPLAWILSAPILAWFHARIGTTFGKFLFGLRVRDVNGNHPTFRQAMRREGGLLIWGAGLGLPLLNLAMPVRSYYEIENGERCKWDVNAETLVQGRDIEGWLKLSVAFGIVVIVSSKALGLSLRFLGY